ncbi:MAG TPA: NADH-quinone oxidoreductase subunit NuoG [Bryobacteraceae bacterium]|nr:NADH-quinone oxidoreductase subunit NuoG [Bryobacteraceae bacterium]
MATIYIDNEPREADSSQNLLHVLLSLGYDLPYFCWHPALGSVGACRQCAVKQFRNEQDTSGKLIMACMTPAGDGTRVSIQDPDAIEFRAAVIQGLMQNHPHDCPVCDEGGECHLQDMTVMTGHCARHYSFSKRTFRNQYLGPFINHEMNRCIQCQRCVRYYREYAGGHDLNAFRLRDVVYFGRFEDGVLENEFAGNLVEICPTGVFTDATLKRHYTRKWDLQMAPSICVHCAAGCNTSVGERYGSLRRVVNRYNHEVNGYFLCDRGRFGYEFVNSEQRIDECLIDGAPVDAVQAASHLESLVRTSNCIGIASPRASLESNFALRQLVGADRFYAGVAADEWSVTLRALELLRSGPAKAPSLDEIEHCDAVFILGEDVTNVLPLMALRLRQSVRQRPIEKAKHAKIPLWLDHAVRELLQDEQGPFFIAAPYATRLDDIATELYRAAPDDLARLAFAVAEAIRSGASDDLAGRIAVALRSAKSPLIVSGASCRSLAVVEAAAQVASALASAGRPAKLAYCFAECNSVGLALLGARPLWEAFSATAETVIILENDLYRRAPTSDVDAFLDSARRVVVLDVLPNRTTGKAELILPAGTFAETDGTLVNYEGRAQRFFQAFVPSGEIRASWHWLSSQDVHLDDIVSAIASEIPALAGIKHAAPSRSESGKIAREPSRYSGRTSMLANISVHEPKPPDDPDSALAFSMESGPAPAPPALNPFFWSPGWNSIQSVNKFQSEIGGHLRGGDPGVRLIEPASQPAPPHTPESPPAFHPGAANFLVLPAFHIFGSEELSSRAPAVASLAPTPYVAINPADSAQIGSDATLAALPVSLRPDIPRGVAVVSSSNCSPTAIQFAPAAEASK